MKKFILAFLPGLLLMALFWGLMFCLPKDKSGLKKPIFSMIFPEKITAVVLPHFDFAAEERKALLEQLKTKVSPSKIILVSVDHFGVSGQDIISTDKQWNFKDGIPLINLFLFEKLVKSGQVANIDWAFLNEHGIKNVFPDLLAVFPEAEYLPIIIKEKTSEEKTEKLAQELKNNCPDCFLVVSIDFSHYCPDSLARIHDQMSIDALINLDEKKAWEAETDSPQVLSLAIKWANLTGAQNFVLDSHANSGQKTGNYEMETTSYITGYFSDRARQVENEKSATFMIGGDLMLDRFVYHQFTNQGLTKIFDRFGKRVFWGTDFSLVNLEGPISQIPITDYPIADDTKFNFPPETVEVLKFLRLKAVSLANNHTLDNGADGLEFTKEVLKQNKISFLGGQNQFNQESLFRAESDVPLSVISINLLGNSENESVLKMIKKESELGRSVIIYPHWGVEYVKIHADSQEELAHSWVDAGADLVVGSHPHVIQDFEIYKNRPIFYSLGNFVFDQVFSNETRIGLLVGGIIKTHEIEISLFPIKIQNLQPEFLKGEERLKIISELFGRIENQNVFEVKEGTIKIVF